MPQRQQRGQPQRGQLPFATIATAAGIPWTAAQTASNAITLTLDANPAGLSLTGIPQMVRSDTSAVPISASLTGATVQLVYASGIGGGVTFTLPSKDPALRAPTGGYLDAGNWGTTPLQAPFGIPFKTGTDDVDLEAVNVSDGTWTGGNIADGAFIGEWAAVVNPPTFPFTITLTGNVTPNTFAPGVASFLVWNGANWS